MIAHRAAIWQPAQVDDDNRTTMAAAAAGSCLVAPSMLFNLKLRGSPLPPPPLSAFAGRLGEPIK